MTQARACQGRLCARSTLGHLSGGAAHDECLSLERERGTREERERVTVGRARGGQGIEGGGRGRAL